MKPKPLLETVAIAKRYGATQALAPTDLCIYSGEFVVILGPSGCGKTTLLRLLGGFLAPSAGAVLIEGIEVTDTPPERRPTNMVFQGYGLFPHMTVAENVAYGLKVRKTPRAEIEQRVRQVLAQVSMDAFALRPASALSGGQQQRVALARALVLRPRVLLLDEPLSALDLKLRRSMQDEMRRLHRVVGGTFVMVTHDQDEALSLGSRIIVMEAGRVVQDGTPADIYRKPANLFVSRFLGDANVLPAVPNGDGPAPAIPSKGPEGSPMLVLRPEAIRLSAEQPDPADPTVRALEGTLTERVFLGARTRYTADLGDARLVDLLVPAGEAAFAVGERAWLVWSVADEHILPADLP